MIKINQKWLIAEKLTKTETPNVQTSAETESAILHGLNQMLVKTMETMLQTGKENIKISQALSTLKIRKRKNTNVATNTGKPVAIR